jgi:hypothetical protein
MRKIRDYRNGHLLQFLAISGNDFISFQVAWMIIEKFDQSIAVESQGPALSHMDEFEPSTGHVLSSLYIAPTDRAGLSKSHVKSAGFFLNALKIVLSFFASNRARCIQARVAEELHNMVTGVGRRDRSCEQLRANEAQFLMSLFEADFNAILVHFTAGISIFRNCISTLCFPLFSVTIYSKSNCY